MAKVSIDDLRQDFIQIDLDRMEAEAIDELNVWEKKMINMIDRIYASRLNEIQQWKSIMTINEMIPEDFQQVIEKTIRIETDDDFVHIDMPKKSNEKVLVILATPSDSNDKHESQMSKLFHSEAVQEVVTIGLTQAISHVGTLAVSNPTTIVAAGVAKAAIVCTASGLGRAALETTKKLWSWMH